MTVKIHSKGNGSFGFTVVGLQSFGHCDWWWDTRCERLRSADVEDMFTMEVNDCYCID